MRAQYARADRIASSSGLSRTRLDPPVGMLPVRVSSPDAAGEISACEISAGEISTTPNRCRCASARSSLTSPASPCEKRVRYYAIIHLQTRQAPIANTLSWGWRSAHTLDGEEAATCGVSSGHWRSTSSRTVASSSIEI